MSQCIELIADRWTSWACRNEARYGNYCGVHSPEKKSERAAKRGPTQFEQDLARNAALREELKQLRADNEQLRAEAAEERDALDTGLAYLRANPIGFWSANHECAGLIMDIGAVMGFGCEQTATGILIEALRLLRSREGTAS